MDKTALQAVKELRTALDGYLPDVCKSHDFKSLKTSKGKYDPTTGFFSLVIEGVIEGGSNREESNYKIMKSIYPELPDVGFMFQYSNKSYKILGSNTRFTKVLARTGNKTYLFKPEYIISLLSRSSHSVPLTN